MIDARAHLMRIINAQADAEMINDEAAIIICRLFKTKAEREASEQPAFIDRSQIGD